MKDLSSLRLVAALALTLALAPGCLSDKGERCYLDSDCSGNLVCCKASSLVTEDGSCQPEGTVCTVPDAGPMDAGADAGTDAGTDAGADSGTP